MAKDVRAKSIVAKPSVRMTRDVKLSINWRDLTSKLSEVVAQGFLTYLGGDGVSGGLSALVGATASIKMEADAGEKAWTLSVLCFAWALDELKSEQEADISTLKATMKSILHDVKKQVDENDEYAPHTFLERPVTLPLYRVMRDAVVARKDVFRTGVQESDLALKARFDAAYERAMFEVLSRRPEIYQSLVTVFSLPGVRAAEQQVNWDAYRKRLIYEFEVRPVFGQEATKLSLAQLYVPLRCYWPKGDAVPPHPLYPRLSTTHDVAMLDEELDKWVESGSEGDDIRLVGGGPGSGKSTTLRAFAKRMANRPEWRPLFIPLQHIDLEGDLREAINRHFTERTNGPFTHSPLSRSAVEDGPPLLLIFDGLDELARPGEAANEVVNLFTTKMTNLTASLRGDGTKIIKVVVSGRMPSFQAAKRYISPPKSGCLAVYGFRPEDDLHRTDGRRRAHNLWKIDQRVLWWRQYAALVDAPLETPPAFSAPQLQGITHEPLLCYLLVLSGFAAENWEQAAENPNRIYRTLVDSVWDRGWGEGVDKRRGQGRTLSKSDFNILMQTIALAAWQGGDTRVASEQGFAGAIKIAQAEDAWENFKRDNGPDVTNLALNFHLKAAEGKQRGFEFTHKSFGDYLTARAILDVAVELPPLIKRKVDHAMTDWVAATGAGTLSSEVLTFLRDEVRLRHSADATASSGTVELKKAFERFVSTILAEGLPVPQGVSSWRSAETKQRNAEVMSWAILNSCSLTLGFSKHPEKAVIVQWPDEKTSFGRLLKRISDHAADIEPALQCFSNVVAPRSNLFGLSLMTIDLSGAQMQSSSFTACNLIRANLKGADLRGSVFYYAMLNSAEIAGAKMDGAFLIDARIPDVDFQQVSLNGARVSEQTLLQADLEFFEKTLPLIRYGENYVNEFELNRTREFFDRLPKVRALVERLIEQERQVRLQQAKSSPSSAGLKGVKSRR